MGRTKNFKIILFVLLLTLNLIFRIPSIPHEMGLDSFGIHSLANSISTFGYAKWWVHSLSIIGFYPYSYASAVPFLISGLSQVTGMETESIIWIYSVIIGIFSIFIAYMLAGAIWNNYLFKYFVAFCFSTSAGVLSYSTWTATSRGLFIILLPLFVYLLLKSRTSTLKYGLLTIILFIVLLATHHLIYFTIPLIVSLLVVTILYKLRRYVKIDRIPENFTNIAFIFSILVLFILPLFFRNFIETERAYTGSRYEILIPLLKNYFRYIGPMIIFTFSAFFHLSLKREKRFEEWFILISLLFVTVFIYMPNYFKWIILMFSAILISFGLMNITKLNAQKRKYAIFVLITSLIISASFSGFYQHWRTNIGGNNPTNADYWYMNEATYEGALWIKKNVDKALISNDERTSLRVFAISEVPTFTGHGTQDLTYGFTNITDINITMNSPLSIQFYFDNPYVRTYGTLFSGWYITKINQVDIDSKWGQNIISRFNLSFVVEYTPVGSNVFIKSVQRDKDNVYDNGDIRIWRLGKT